MWLNVIKYLVGLAKILGRIYQNLWYNQANSANQKMFLGQEKVFLSVFLSVLKNAKNAWYGHKK